MKSFKTTTRRALLLAIFLFSLLFQGQNAKAQWWKDTVWTKETDQSLLSNLKFSNNDSIIVGGGLFIDAKTGNEIGRIYTSNNEYFFLKDDKKFLKLNDDDKTFEIFDTKTYKIIDSLESDGVSTIKFSSQTISSDYKYVAVKINNGFRIWNIETKRIEWTKIFQDEKFLKEIMVNKILFNCDNSKIYVRLWRKYHDPQKPDKPEYYTTKHQTIIYDLNTNDSIDVIDNNYIFLSNTCKYMIKGVGGDNGIEIYDFNTKEFLFALPLNILTVSGLEFSPDDKYLVTAPTITIWDLAKKVKVYQYSSGSSHNIDLSHDGKYIINSIGGHLANWYARWDGTSIVEQTTPEKTLYPNPANNTIMLTFSIEKPLQLNYSLYIGTGNLYKILFNEFSNSGIVQKKFNISELPNGTYFLKISGQEFSLTYKVVIMR